MSDVTAKHTTPAGVNARVASSYDLTPNYMPWFTTMKVLTSPWAVTPTRLLNSATILDFKMQRETARVRDIHIIILMIDERFIFRIHRLHTTLHHADRYIWVCSETRL